MKEKSQYIIFIDASERGKHLVKLVDKALNEDEVVDALEGDVDIVQAISALLKKNNLKLSDIAEFKSNLGPGSFTGLKMGATIANVLNWALGKKKIEELSFPEYGREPNITPPKKFKLG